MANQCQYDLEAHFGHIITFLIHPHTFVSVISFAFLN